MNTNAAKLNANTVQQIRALSSARFTTTSIAGVFCVVPRAVRNLLRGRAWSHVPVEPTPLTVLPLDAAYRLKLRAGPQKLNEEQREVIERYAEQLVQKDDDAERTAFASELIGVWTPRRPAQRKDHRERAATSRAEAIDTDASTTAVAADPTRTGAGLWT